MFMAPLIAIFLKLNGVDKPVKFAPLPLNDVAVIIPVVLILVLDPTPVPVNAEPSPEKDVAVTVPFTVTPVAEV